MKPTAPDRVNANVIAMTPCRGRFTKCLCPGFDDPQGWSFTSRRGYLHARRAQRSRRNSVLHRNPTKLPGDSSFGDEHRDGLYEGFVIPDTI